MSPIDTIQRWVAGRGRLAEHEPMLAKAVATLALLALPFSLALWYRSHQQPEQHRFDVTLYKSAWVFLKDGTCAVQVLCLPTRTPSRSEFRASMTSNSWSPMAGSLSFTAETKGRYKWISVAFPLWVPNAALSMVCGLGLLYGPFRTAWRRARAHCVACGYNLQGLRGSRCPECGSAFLPSRSHA